MDQDKYGFGARIEERDGHVGVAFDPKTVRLAFKAIGEALFEVVEGTGVPQESPLYAMLCGVIVAEQAAAFVSYPETLVGKTPVEVFASAMVRFLEQHGHEVRLQLYVAKKPEAEQNAPGTDAVN